MLQAKNLLKRTQLLLRRKNKIVGWDMMPEQAIQFFKRQQRRVITFLGYSTFYEDEEKVGRIVEQIINQYSPKDTLINYGVTKTGLGVLYPIAKSLGFTTTGIVSTRALKNIDNISTHVDLICFIKDEQWGGKIPGSDELSPTSRAMVLCSDVLVGIGGGEISRDEMVFGRQLGKPVHFFPADINHQWLAEKLKKTGGSTPADFSGAAHQIFSSNENPPEK